MITSKSEAVTTKTKVSPAFEKFHALANKVISVSKADLNNRGKVEQEKKRTKKS